MITLNDYQEIWFAWYPVKTESGEWAWLEYVGITLDTYWGSGKNFKYYKIER